jgi:hypothetical protein
MSNKDIEDMKKQFDTLSGIMKNLQNKSKTIMPLVSDSLELTIKIIEVYKEAYTSGLDKDGKKKTE